MISDSNNSKASLSSLPLEVLLHFNWHFSFLFFLATVCLYVYKCKLQILYLLFVTGLFNMFYLFFVYFVAVRYYYPGSILAWDLVSIFAYVIVESTRLFLGETLHSIHAILSLIFTLMCSTIQHQKATRPPS